MLRSIALLLLAATTAPGQQRTNRPAGVELFRDRGFGLFIHWSVDAPLGGVISHSLVGAAPDYVERFFRILPAQFNPVRYNPEEWAALAKLAGFEYVVFTTKHHAGFCMWDTATTQFSVKHTPYAKDVTRDLVDAFRKQGIAIGFYFSPDDFWWLHQNRIRINRHVKGVYPQEIPAFMDYTKRQLKELLTSYGRIDYLFFDGPAEQLTGYAWQLQPEVIITRGVMETPEQYIPGVPLEGAWEGNLTMGTEWPWKPTNEVYKSGTELIEIIIETRAKGGNLLLNIGPKPDGEIPIEQESRLREIALWNFVNAEAIKNVRPWVITNENNIWFTRQKDSNTVYAFLTKMHPWKLGEPRTVTLRSVRATPRTQISVLGQSDEVVEYRPEVNPKTTWKQDESGLHVTAYRAQRLYTDRRWPNPLVLKITNVEPGLTPPEVLTSDAEWNPSAGAATLRGRLTNLGGVNEVEVGFQYREKKGGTDLPGTSRSSPGEFTFVLRDLQPNRPYEFRARVRHPLITIYGRERTFQTSPAARAASVAAAAFFPERLAALRDDLARRGTRALLIVKDGNSALEWYAPGASASTKHFTASLAKALVGGTSLLLATADGRIRPDQRAAAFIPGWADDPHKRRITVRHLATHTSGLEDAEQDDLPHAQLPGWKGAFWKREPDPFTIAVRAPVLFDPGSAYHYSNPGMAALAWAVTASLRGWPHADIRTLLRERVFSRIGVSDDDWSIGYGRAYEVEGLNLWANWGGGSFTPRATARIGEWMMNRGRWQGEELIPERVVEAALRYTGTPLPSRDHDRYAPATTLGWYTNIDRVWPAVPPDAFAGAGAQHQVLLVVPTLGLIVVRNGAALEPTRNPEQFWTPLYRYLFEPVMQALREPPRPLAPPYPASKIIRSVTFEPESSIRRSAIGSDNWPITWARDGHLYTSWGDGWGFEPLLKEKLSLGLSRVEGSPGDFRGINIRSPSLERPGDGAAGPKASGMISVDGVLYMWVRNAGNAQLLWSENNGQHWSWGFKLTESFGSPAFLNFGRDNAGARDEYVYTYSQDRPSAYESADGIVLARAHKTRLRERGAWEFFAGNGAQGRPRWARDIKDRKPVFQFPGNCQRTDAVYNPALKRYLLTVGYGHRGGWGIYDAPEPWGPWTTAFHTEYWGLGQTHGYRLPSKWISPDGRGMALVFSGLVYNNVSYDAFCVRRMKLNVGQ